MSTPRQQFLDRVRRAVAEGNRAGAAVPLDDRGEIGYQGAGHDLVSHFCEQLIAQGGQPYQVNDRPAARARLLDLVQTKRAQRILLGSGELLDALRLPEELHALGIQVTTVNTVNAETCRDPFFAADLAISGADYLIAETGSLVVFTRPDQPRSLSLLPPVHVVVAEAGQVLPDLFDLFARLEVMPSCLTLITGPSKTGDIELRLVTGVHGPGEVHVVLIDPSGR